MQRLSELFKDGLPLNARDENSEWYKLFKSVENKPTVYSVHRDFLLLRDYTTLSLLFIMIFGASGFLLFSTTHIALIYLALLVIQFAVVRQAASNCGIRMVTNVLALKTTAAR